MTDLAIIKLARQRAHAWAAKQEGNTDQAAIDGYEADALTDEAGIVRRDLWDAQQELIYRYAFAQQLLALGL